MPLQVRRGPTADRTAITPVSGELIYDTTEKILYIGDGVTPGGVAASSFTFEDAQDAAASLLTSGIHSNISFSYNDVAGRIDANLDLTNYNGFITADGFKGSLFADDSSLLVDGVLGSFQLNGTVRTDIVPFANETYDLGSPTNKFKDLYLSGSSLFLGDAQITSTGTVVNLPAGSTIGGNAIASGALDGSFVGDIKGSVFADDSSLLVDGVTGQIVGDINARLADDLDTNGHRILGTVLGIAPVFYTVFGSEDLNRNGSVTISRFNFTGGGYGTNTPLIISHVHNSSSIDRQVFYRARGTGSVPLPVQSGDRIGEISFLGDTLDSIGFSQYSASFRAVVDGSNSGNNAPGRIEFLTNSGTGLRQSCQITSQGILKVNNIEPLSGGSLTVTGDLIGSIFSDDSTKIVDGTDGSITAGSFIQFGSFTTAERDALTPAFGMVIYNTTVNKFQGYQNTGGITPQWINLDDGSVA